jgi:hypothetical protein
METRCVFFEVETQFLNIIKMLFISSRFFHVFVQTPNAKFNRNPFGSWRHDHSCMRYFCTLCAETA